MYALVLCVVDLDNTTEAYSLQTYNTTRSTHPDDNMTEFSVRPDVPLRNRRSRSADPPGVRQKTSGKRKAKKTQPRSNEIRSEPGDYKAVSRIIALLQCLPPMRQNGCCGENFPVG